MRFALRPEELVLVEIDGHPMVMTPEGAASIVQRGDGVEIPGLTEASMHSVAYYQEILASTVPRVLIPPRPALLAVVDHVVGHDPTSVTLQDLVVQIDTATVGVHESQDLRNGLMMLVGCEALVAEEASGRLADRHFSTVAGLDAEGVMSRLLDDARQRIHDLLGSVDEPLVRAALGLDEQGPRHLRSVPAGT
jgi:hypothetical protein